MPEGVLDGGQVAGTGHGPRMGRQRPADIPEDWVRDRATKQWRPPKRPGPRQPDDTPPGDGGWRAERDPDPARLAGDGSPDGEEPPPEVTDEVLGDLAGAVGLLGLIVLPPVVRADPYCGQALAQAWPQVTEACIPLLVRSPAVVRWMTSAGGLRDWVGLGIALQPVAEAVYRHHIAKTVTIVQTEQGPVAGQADLSGYTA